MVLHEVVRIGEDHRAASSLVSNTDLAHDLAVGEGAAVDEAVGEGAAARRATRGELQRTCASPACVGARTLVPAFRCAVS